MEDGRIRGKVVSEVYRGRNGYSVLRVQSADRIVTAVGYVAEEGSVQGISMAFEGRFEFHPKYERQFRFSSYRMEDSSLFFFLARVVKGLGENLAREVIQAYGEDEIVRILEEDPAKLEEIKGIKGKKRGKIVESWQKHKAIYGLSSYLGPCGVSTNTILRIYNHFGESAVERVRENPYCLTEIHGFGFKSADRVAARIGVDPSSPFRIAECLTYVLQKTAEDGSTVMEPPTLAALAKKEMDNEEEGVSVSPKAVSQGVRDLLSSGRATEIGGHIALSGYYAMERRILERVEDRTRGLSVPVMGETETERFLRARERAMGMMFSMAQKEFVRMVARGKRTAILCGYAGTGKSTIAKVALDLLAEAYGRDSVVCMCLSGVAARRVRKLTGHRSNTIHTVLKWNGSSFEYGRANRLPFRVVMLDESSMVNSALFCRVFDALRDDAVFLMLGDDAQLPPIGAGDVFADLIRSGRVPTVKLTQIFRQSEDSVLVEFANTIRQGRVPQGYKSFGYKDFRFIDKSIENYWMLRTSLSKQDLDALKAKNTQEIIDQIVAQARAAKPRITDPVSDFQVLTPMRGYALGTENLNKVLQEVLNPGGDDVAVERFGVRFKPGDKVVHLHNKDMAVMSLEDYRAYGFSSAPEGAVFKQRIFNGNVGVIEALDQEEEAVYVRYPMDEGDLAVRYEFTQMADIVGLAYCLSVHKAQGNEYREVVVPISSQHYVMLNSKWMYTAVTRGRERATLVGQSYMFERGCRTSDETKRKTVISLLSPPVPAASVARSAEKGGYPAS